MDYNNLLRKYRLNPSLLSLFFILLISTFIPTVFEFYVNRSNLKVTNPNELNKTDLSLILTKSSSSSGLNEPTRAISSKVTLPQSPEIIEGDVKITNTTRWDNRYIILRGNLHLTRNAILILNNSTLLFQRPPGVDENFTSATSDAKHQLIPTSNTHYRGWWEFTADLNTTFIMDNKSYLGVVQPPNWNASVGNKENILNNWFDAYLVRLHGTEVILRRSEVNSAGFIPRFLLNETMLHRLLGFTIMNASRVIVENMRFTNNFDALEVINTAHVVISRTSFSNTNGILVESSTGVGITYTDNNFIPKLILILNNTFQYLFWGIYIGMYPDNRSSSDMMGSVERSLIADNVFSHVFDAAIVLHNVRSKPNGTLIFRNTIQDFYLFSGGIRVIQQSENITIWQNVFQGDSTIDDPNNYRGANLISFSFGSKLAHFVIKENLFTHVWTAIGMQPTEVSDVMIENNWFVNAYLGVAIDYSDVDDSKDIRILYNAFINITSLPELWVDFSARAVMVDDGSRGNYWDRHARLHEDSDGDGIIDVPYVIYDNITSNDSLDDVIDAHPLAEPDPIPWMTGYPSPWNDIIKSYLIPRQFHPSNGTMQNNETMKERVGFLRLEFDWLYLFGSVLTIFMTSTIRSRHVGKKKQPSN